VTLLDQLLPRPAREMVTPEPPKPKIKRRRWVRQRVTKKDRIAAEQCLADALRAKRAKWAASLVPNQTELLGPMLPDGVEMVRQDQEGL
jgi:hypothetical protein